MHIHKLKIYRRFCNVNIVLVLQHMAIVWNAKLFSLNLKCISMYLHKHTPTNTHTHTQSKLVICFDYPILCFTSRLLHQCIVEMNHIFQHSQQYMHCNIISCDIILYFNFYDCIAFK